MTSVYYTFVTVLVLAVAASILDPKVPYYLSLKVQMAIINIRRLYLMFILHPRNEFTTWMINRRIKSLTQQLQEQLNNGSSNDDSNSNLS